MPDAKDLMQEGLRALGWAIEHVEQRHVDIEVRAVAGDLPVRLLGLSPFSTAGVVARAVADPSFFVLEVGSVEHVRAWGTWTRFMAPSQGLAGFQCAVGKGSLLLAAGFDAFHAQNAAPVEEFFQVVRELAPRLIPRSRKEPLVWPDLEPARSLQGWPTPASRLRRKVMKGALAAGGFAVAGGSFALDVPEIAPYALMAGIVGAVLLIAQGSVRRWTPLRKRAAATVKRLRASSLFDDVTDPLQVSTETLPLIRSASGLRYEGQVFAERLGIVAESVKTGLTMRVAFCGVPWPADALKACRVIPSTWTVVEVQGPGAMIDAFPVRDRSAREQRRLVWLLDEQETKQDALWAMLDEVERGMRVGEGSPYR